MLEVIGSKPPNISGYIDILLNSAFSIAFLLDHEGKIRYISNNIHHLTSTTNSERLLGKSLTDIYELFGDEETIKRAKSRLGRIISGEKTLLEDESIVFPSGVRRIFRINYKRIMGEDSDLNGIFVYAQDITDLRWEEAEHRISDLVNTSLLPCLIWDEEGTTIEFNSVAAKTFGIPDHYSPPKFHEYFFSFLPEYQPDGRKTEAIRQRVIAEALEKGFAQTTVMLANNDGREMFFTVNATRISWLFGHRLVVHFSDMTEIMHKEAAAREAEERTKLMLDCSPLACILRDADGNVVDCNQEALDMLRVPNKTFLSENYYHMFPEFQQDGRRSTDMLNEIMNEVDEKGSINLERTFRSLPGELIPVETRVVRIPWRNTHCYLSFSRDLREIKENEQKMKEIAERERMALIQRETAQAANEAKNKFIATMSHEIRTPMNAVLGMSELLLHEKLNTRQRRYVNDIRTSAMSLLDIINEILDVSKLQAGKLKLVPVHFSLNELLDNISSMARFLVEEKEVHFNLIMPEQMSIILYGDEIRLRQVILNLLGNAIKFTEKGFVFLMVEVHDETIRITVKDSGIGIKKENIPRLFDAFEQTDVIKNRNIKGTGLGLTIANSIVELMGGKISIESEYGVGSSFHVDIPKNLGDESLILQTSKEEEAFLAPEVKILVVDDSKINLDVVVGLLGLYQITADTAISGYAAIEKLNDNNNYDIVFMDHMMPEMDGIETTKLIRKSNIYLPIIALTANAVSGARENMIAAGMDDYLSKPIIKAELNYILKKWIPADKIIKLPTVSTVPRSSKNERDSELWNDLEQIEELSLSVGLERVGGERNIFRNTLKLMIREIERSRKRLQEFLVTGDMKGFCVEVHGIKGALANVGAMELSAQALALENASREEDASFCHLHLPVLLKGLDSFHRKLDDAFATASDGDSSPTEMPPELSPVLQDLQKAYEDFDFLRIDQEVENLRSLDLGDIFREELEQILDSVMMMDYDDASARIKNLVLRSEKCS